MCAEIGRQLSGVSLLILLSPLVEVQLLVVSFNLKVLTLLDHFIQLLFINFDLCLLHTLHELGALDLRAGALSKLQTLAQIALKSIIYQLNICLINGQLLQKLGRVLGPLRIVVVYGWRRRLGLFQAAGLIINLGVE